VDLALALRVLFRHRHVVAIGLVLAAFLALLSYYKVSLDGTPQLTPRKAEIWQSDATVFLTQGGFPAGRRDQFTTPAAYSSLAALYARLAQSDQVQALANAKGPLPGLFQAIPAADPLSRDSALPMVTLLGKSTTPERAFETVTRGTAAFLAHIRGQQQAARIPVGKRIQLSVVNAPSSPVLIQPRKKTLPIVVFLAVAMAAFALAFILENFRRVHPVEAVEPELDAILPAEPPSPVPVRVHEADPVRVHEADHGVDTARIPIPEPEVEPEPVRPVRRWA
jgi:hypothetical protein